MTPAILITGSEGNMGAYLQKSVRAAHSDARVIRVTRKTEGAAHPDLYRGDLRDRSFVRKIFAENAIDAVIHLAATAYSARGFREEAFDLLHDDVGMTLALLAECAKAKKLVYVSSALVYESGNASPFTERMTRDIPPPRSAYGISKYLGEQAVLLLHEQYGVPYTIWRPFNIVSPLEPHDGDGHSFTDLYRRIFVEGQPEITLYGGGNQVRCFTWVEDAADALADYLFDERTSCQLYNIGGDEPTTLLALKDLLVELGHEKGILPLDYRPGTNSSGSFAGVDSRARLPSIEKARTELGWAPTTSLRECFSRFIDYKQDHAH